MNNVDELRDHRKPCEHLGDPRLGAWSEEDNDGSLVWLCAIKGCPGGKKVIPQEGERWRSVEQYDGDGHFRYEIVAGDPINGRLVGEYAEQ